MAPTELNTDSGFGTPLASLPDSGTSTPASGLGPNGQRRTKICVYCGSSPGYDAAHMEAARDLARVMAANNIGLGKQKRSSPMPGIAT